MLDKQSQIVLNPIMGLYILAPITTQIPVINWYWKDLMEIRDTLWGILAEQIIEHKKNFSPIAEPTDFTYAYLNEIYDRKNGDKNMGFFDEKQLQMLLLDLFFAGMETTVTTAKWGILMLMLHPEAAQRAQEELDQLPERIVLSDKTHLIYVNALINEIQRTANILPINLLRAVAEDIEIDGYRFPAGSMVLPQISITMNDPENFENPEKFLPERFIDENNNLKKVETLIPFSIGKRQCLGESLARAELFLIFANLLRNFDFICPDPENPPSLERVYGLTVSPKPYLCVIKKRVI
uniref:Cytochrome P450 n=1 Tax=Panagrolaimus superbus TaxID=310955 RepID=A0A914Z2J1_9BILA